MRVLCISPFSAPLANAESFCGGKTALALQREGVEQLVYCVDYTGSAKFKPDSSAIWAPLAPCTRPIPPHAGRSKLWSGPLALRYLTPEWSRWIAGVVEDARARHQEQPFDVVFSRGLPNVAHLAGYWAARQLGLPWVANFNDPWDLEGAHLLPQHRDQRPTTWRHRVQDRWLRTVMRTADLVTFPCARLRDYHLRLVSREGPTAVVPHIGVVVPPDPATQEEGFRLVHAGNLGAGESTRRNSTAGLLRAVRAFLERRPEARERFRLVLVGGEDPATTRLAAELGLGGVLQSTGRVNYFESTRWMAAASACLLVEGEMPEGIYLASKFPDYVTAGKPVIALSPEIGTIADLRGHRGLTVVKVSDPAAIEGAIAKHFEAWAAGRLETLAPEAGLRERYELAAVGRQWLELFGRLSQGSRRGS